MGFTNTNKWHNEKNTRIKNDVFYKDSVSPSEIGEDGRLENKTNKITMSGGNWEKSRNKSHNILHKTNQWVINFNYNWTLITGDRC